MVAEEDKVDLPSSASQSYSDSADSIEGGSIFGFSKLRTVPSLIFKALRSFLQSHELERRLYKPIG